MGSAEFHPPTAPPCSRAVPQGVSFAPQGVAHASAAPPRVAVTPGEGLLKKPKSAADVISVLQRRLAAAPDRKGDQSLLLQNLATLIQDLARLPQTGETSSAFSSPPSKPSKVSAHSSHVRSSSPPPRKARCVSPSDRSGGVSSDLSPDRSASRSPPRLAPFSPSVGGGHETRPPRGEDGPPGPYQEERLEQLRAELLQKFLEAERNPREEGSHRSILLAAVDSLSRLCPDLTFLPSVVQHASQAEKQLNLKRSLTAEPTLKESPFLGHIFTELHYKVAGEPVPPDSGEQVPPLPPQDRLPHAQPLNFLFQASGRSTTWKAQERTGVLPNSHHVPSGEDFCLLDRKGKYADKGRPLSLTLGTVHTLYANLLRTLEELSSSHNFVTGLSTLVSTSPSLSRFPDLLTLLQATLLSVQHAMWDGSRALYNLELTLRADALQIAKVVEQEARTLRAQPFSRTSLFGPSAVLASSQRIVEDNAINEARKEVQRKSDSRSSGRQAAPKSSSQKKPSDTWKTPSSSSNRFRRSSSVMAAASITKRYDQRSKQKKSKSRNSGSKPFQSSGRSKNANRGSRPSGKGPQ